MLCNNRKWIQTRQKIGAAAEMLVKKNVIDHRHSYMFFSAGRFQNPDANPIYLQTGLHHLQTLFRNKKFILNSLPQRNASKFAIFYEYENPKLLFPFHATLFFSLMNALVYDDKDQGIH